LALREAAEGLEAFASELPAIGWVSISSALPAPA